MIEVDEKYFEIKSTNSKNNHVTSSPCAKRKRVEPSSLSEQEQIALAIGKNDLCYCKLKYSIKTDLKQKMFK